MKKKLQFLTLEREWKYVFCYNQNRNCIISTNDKEKAIPGDAHALNYFQSKFSSREFRIV